MTEGHERKHVLDYTHVDLHYVEDQRKNLVNKFNLLKQELSLHNSELCNLKHIVSINCSLQNEVIRINLENESLKDEISDLKKALEGKGKRKEKISSKEVFTKADESSSIPIYEITSDSESECETQEPLLPLPMLIRAEPVVVHDKKADSSTKQLLLTLIEEVKGLKRQIEIPFGISPSVTQSSSLKSTKQKTWFGRCKHYGLRNHLSDDCYSKPKCFTCGSTDHLTKEHTEQVVVRKTLTKLKAQSSMNPSHKKAPMIPKPFKECKYDGFNDPHFDNCEYYFGCEVCGSVAHEPTDCPKKHPNTGNQGLLTSDPLNSLKSGFAKETNLCENVCA
ncbi:hypothetical protein Tco_1229071 [Tanacetum coccineum]